MITKEFHLTLEEARALAICSQHLSENSKLKDPVEVVRALAGVQYDPNPVVSQNHYLVLWNRIPEFKEEDLDRAAYHERTLIEVYAMRRNKFFVPTDEFILYRKATRQIRRWGGSDADREAKECTSEDKRAEDMVVQAFAKNGPMVQEQLWTNLRHYEEWKDYVKRTRSGQKVKAPPLISAFYRMLRRGDVIVADRLPGTFRQPVFGLKDLLIPGPWPNENVTEEEATRWLVLRILKAYGITDRSHIAYITGLPSKKVEEALEYHRKQGLAATASIEGIRGQWWVIPDWQMVIEKNNNHRKISLLSPLDNFVRNRKWLNKLFNYTFTMEYFQKKNMKWQLSILFGSDFVGYVDCKADRKKNQFLVKSAEIKCKSKCLSAALDNSLLNLAKFHGLSKIIYL
ncbi:hypothetical protein BBF96_10295 [Anoxybacter fermentans]|uniref:Winged helix DNA-binding domain-containing protein n=1 Tax=Anoxybacter fermentans TaxID=1323375 RepID=A0A3S9SZR5_9FIRM|nr:winged helix DNA-binding domain-containing protein [Anoxybacter fermentans]AZR73740.1 hypothetical protein BBF96_10295 [Anoxybacter fermentans]